MKLHKASYKTFSYFSPKYLKKFSPSTVLNYSEYQHSTYVLPKFHKIPSFLKMSLYHLSEEVKWSEVKSLSHVWLFVTPWAVAYQAPQSMGFSREEYWSRLSFPSPGDLPDPGIEPGSPAL